MKPAQNFRSEREKRGGNMKITGVICEYNPFHLGHAYQLAQARELCGGDTAVVCVMSGDFVQRGEPAIVGKHARAEMAVLGGADIVFELPLPWAIGSAERFASGGVALLDAVGADFISFGCECPDAERLLALATAARSEEVSLRIRRELGSGVSYAAAREKALRGALGDEALLLREPNNILAVEYLKAMLASGSKMVPLAVPRFGATARPPAASPARRRYEGSSWRAGTHRNICPPRRLPF